MTGFNMDMMSMPQNMYGGFGGQNLGMNGMNGMNHPNGMDDVNMGAGMGMGMNAAQGGYDDWSGQPSWNMGQEMFNSGGGGAIEAAMNSGFGANAPSAFHPHHSHHHHHHHHLPHPHPHAHPHPHPRRPAAPATGYNLTSTHPNFSQMPHNQHFRPNLNHRDGFQGLPGRGFLPHGPRAGRGGRGFSHHAPAGRGAGNYGRGLGGGAEAFHHQLPSRLHINSTESSAHGQSPHLPNGSLANEQTDAKTLTGPGDTEDQQQSTKVSEQGASEATAVDGVVNGERGEPTQATVPGTIAAGSALARAEVTPAAADSQAGRDANSSRDADRLGRRDLGRVSTDGFTEDESRSPTRGPPGSRALNAPLGPAALMHAEQPLADYPGRVRGMAARGGFRDAPLRGGGAGLSPGRGPGLGPSANGVNVTLARPAAAKSTRPDPLPATAVETKGPGVVGAPTAPRALREGLPNTGSSGRGLSILGRGGNSANGAAGAVHAVNGKRRRFVWCSSTGASNAY